MEKLDFSNLTVPWDFEKSGYNYIDQSSFKIRKIGLYYYIIFFYVKDMPMINELINKINPTKKRTTFLVLEGKTFHHKALNNLYRKNLEVSSSATENIISSLPQYLWPPNLAKW